MLIFFFCILLRIDCIDSMLKHCAANRKIRLSALPNVSPYIYDVNISGFTRSSIYIIHMTLVGLGLITEVLTSLTRDVILQISLIQFRVEHHALSLN
jgi:hypothetical protein